MAQLQLVRLKQHKTAEGDRKSCAWLRNAAIVDKWFIRVYPMYRALTIQGGAGVRNCPQYD